MYQHSIVVNELYFSFRWYIRQLALYILMTICYKITNIFVAQTASEEIAN